LNPNQAAKIREVLKDPDSRLLTIDELLKRGGVPATYGNL